MSGRFYFYRNGAELKTHELNGGRFIGTGAWRQGVHGVRTTITAGYGATQRAITAADFGGDPVLVKEWHPSTFESYGHSDLFWLVPDSISALEVEALRDVPTPRGFRHPMRARQ